MIGKRRWLGLALAGVLVPGSITAFAFTVYGDELTGALPFSSAPATPRTTFVAQPQAVPVVIDVPLPPLLLPPPPPTPDVVQRNVSTLFLSNGVKGITFAPGSSDFVGPGYQVQSGVGELLHRTGGAAITLVSHAWNGETASHRCDVLAMERAALVREFLVSRGVPVESIRTKVIVDPVWGPPSDGGPAVDVQVS
ncbi:hypothetical protein [Umezawaea tangerina]|uniref:Outer membrane protein OmpA-like peptidoglycan-associated protein n=1 Tax=Umezawaea tangerina TaxID=84725 RepID=A0A2T0TAY9_9PSEU|nr:hypothetical protein [Umezawaea tangerina]PRY42827.1 hypothetical protein CLV43_104664 [Umezawaea tangerina]